MSSPLPRPFLLSAFLLVAVSSDSGTAGADVFVPLSSTTTSVLALPMRETVYVPTTYAYTSYSPTVYTDSTLSPTSYYYTPTTYTYTYRSRYVSPRRAARMGLYTPTTYYEYVPTVYTSPVVSTSAVVSSCVESPAPTMPVPPPATPGGASPTQYGAKAPIKSTPSTPAEKAPTPEPGLINKPSTESPAPELPASKDPVPAAPAPEVPSGPITPPPADPKPGGDLGANLGAKEIRRDAMKPKPGELTIAPTRAPALIRGRVTSGITGAPMPKAKVVLTNVRFANPRSFTTDDAGGFEVQFLPDGDWNLAVEDKDGKALEFGVLTVSAGRVYDADGRTWTSFNLSR